MTLDSKIIEKIENFKRLIMQMIPSKTSELVNDSNYIQESSTTGYIKNDGSIGTPANTTYNNGDGLLLNNTTFSVNFGTGNKQVARGDHEHSNYLTSHQNITGKADKTNGASQITDNNANNYSNIATLSNGVTQQVINKAINDKFLNIEGNKVTSISSSSTDTQYPSALAVKTYVENYAQPQGTPTLEYNDNTGILKINWS